MKKCLIVLCALLLTAGTLWAEVVRLDPVVVTATRTGTPLSQIASSVTVITAEEIEAKQQPLVVDLLRSVPGVYVSRTGGSGGITSIYLRGTDNKHTLVMIDGIEVNDPSAIGSAANLTNLTTDNIDRIEVVRGAQSVLYGSDAIGGVINIITKKGASKPEGYVSVEGGSYDTWKEQAGLSAGGDSGYLSFTVSHSKTDGFSTANEKNGNTEDDGYKNTSFSLTAGAKPSDLFELNLIVHHTDAEYDFDSAFGTPIDADNIQEMRELSGRIEGIFHLQNDRWLLTPGISYTEIKRDYDTEGFAGRFLYDYEGSKTKFDLQNIIHINAYNTLAFGAETETEKAENSFGQNDKATNNAIYFEERFTAKEFTTVLGARYDKHEEFGDTVTWRIAPSYTFTSTDTRIKGSIGTGFKAPTLYELYAPAYIDWFSGDLIPVGNEDLDPEESLSWDIGVEQSLFNSSFIVSLTYFHNDIDDYIHHDDTDGYVNIEGLTTQGIESTIEWYPCDYFDTRINYTYTDSENKEDGSRLLRRPLHKGSFDLNFRFLENKMVNFNILYIGERDDIDSKTLDDYILVNLAASHQITDNVKGFIRIDNLFDKDYEEVSGYGTAGLSGYAGIKLSF